MSPLDLSIQSNPDPNYKCDLIFYMVLSLCIPATFKKFIFLTLKSRQRKIQLKTKRVIYIYRYKIKQVMATAYVGDVIFVRTYPSAVREWLCITVLSSVQVKFWISLLDFLVFLLLSILMCFDFGLQKQNNWF